MPGEKYCNPTALDLSATVRCVECVGGAFDTVRQIINGPRLRRVRTKIATAAICQFSGIHIGRQGERLLIAYDATVHLELK